MKKTDQEEFNEVVFESIEGLRDALNTGSESRDILLSIIKFEGTRLDSLDNKVGILMSERAEARDVPRCRLWRTRLYILFTRSQGCRILLGRYRL